MFNQLNIYVQLENNVKVIRFPQEQSRVKKEIVGNAPKLYLGQFSVTCVCGNVATIEPINMIFRSVEFYCSKCGIQHKISNPAFGPIKK